MCSICGQYPCATNCPDYEPRKICECPDCGFDVRVGEEYTTINGLCYHLDCVKDWDMFRLTDCMNINLVQLLNLLDCPVEIEHDDGEIERDIS